MITAMSNRAARLGPTGLDDDFLPVSRLFNVSLQRFDDMVTSG
jgi:hypothetical protein